MSHELRTPLNAIIGHADVLLLNQNLSDEVIDSLQNVRKAGVYLLSLVNQTLDLERIESGNMEMSIEDISIKNLIADCINLSNLLANKKNINLSAYIENDVIVKADYFRLKLVLLNLISNAIKYNEDNGYIKIYIKKNENKVLLSVKDNGYGIKKSHLDKIFTPFQRGRFENSAIEGSGIGLVVSKKLIEKMNGVLHIESPEGVGSTFSIELDAAKNASAPEKAVKISASNNQRKDVGVNNFHPQKRHHLLVADDNPSNQIVLSKQLSYLGYQYKIVDNGQQCIDELDNNQYSLIIMDCNMPVLDGYQATKKIRMSERDYKQIPIIAFTADAMLEKKISCFHFGMDDYLSKPISINDLGEKIFYWLEHESENGFNVEKMKF